MKGPFFGTIWSLILMGVAVLAGMHVSENAPQMMEALPLPTFLAVPLTNQAEAPIVMTLLGVISGFLVFFGGGYVWQSVLDAARVSLAHGTLVRAVKRGEFERGEAEPELYGWFYYPLFSRLWHDFTDSLHRQVVVDEAGEERTHYRSTVPAELYFNHTNMVDTPMRVEFFRHLPGILTGAGIVSTFAGILLGLTDFNPTVEASQVTQQLKHLFTGVSTAFVASFIAILTAISVTVLEKLILHWRYAQITRLQGILDDLFPGGVESEYLADLAYQGGLSSDGTPVARDDGAARALHAALAEPVKQMADAAQQAAQQQQVQSQTLADLSRVVQSMAGDMKTAMARFEASGQATQQSLEKLLEQPQPSAGGTVAEEGGGADMAQAMRGGLEGLAQQLDVGQQAQMEALARGPELLAGIGERLEQITQALAAQPTAFSQEVAQLVEGKPQDDTLKASLDRQEQLLQGVKGAVKALNESLLNLKPAAQAGDQPVAPSESSVPINDAAFGEAARMVPAMESALKEIRQILQDRLSEQGGNQQQLLTVLTQLDENLNRGAAQREALLMARMSQEQGSLSESLQEMLQTGVQTMESSVATLMEDLAKRETTDQEHFQVLREGQNQLESQLDVLRDQDAYQGQELEGVRDALEGQEDKLDNLLGLHNDADARLQGVEINQGQHQASLDNLSAQLHRQESMISEELGILKEQEPAKGFLESLQNDQMALARRLDTMHEAQDQTGAVLKTALDGQKAQLLEQLEGMEDLRQAQQELRDAQDKGLARGDVLQQLTESIHTRHADRLARLQRKLAKRLERLERRLSGANTEELAENRDQLQQLNSAVTEQVGMLEQLKSGQTDLSGSQQQATEQLKAMNEEQQDRLSQLTDQLEQAQQRAQTQEGVMDRQLTVMTEQLTEADSRSQHENARMEQQLDGLLAQVQEVQEKHAAGEAISTRQLVAITEQLTAVEAHAQNSSEAVESQLANVAEKLDEGQQQSQTTAEGFDHHLESIAQQLGEMDNRQHAAEETVGNRLERVSSAFAQLREKLDEMAISQEQKLAGISTLSEALLTLQGGVETQQQVLNALHDGLNTVTESQQTQGEQLQGVADNLQGLAPMQTSLDGYGAQLQDFQTQLSSLLQQDASGQLSGLRSMLEGQPAMLDVLKGGLDRVVNYVEQRQQSQDNQTLSLEEGVEGLLGNLQENLNLQGEVLLKVREHQAETASEYEKIRDAQQDIAEHMSGMADAQRESTDAMNLTRADGLDSRRFMESVMDAQQAIRSRMGELGDVQRLLQNALGSLEETQDEVRTALHQSQASHEESQGKFDGVVTHIADSYKKVQNALKGQHELSGAVQESLGEMRAEQGIMHRGVVESLKAVQEALPDGLPEVVENLRTTVGQTLRDSMKNLQDRVEGIGQGMDRAQTAMGLSINEIRALLQQTGAERDARMAERLESMGEANRNRHQAMMNTLEGLSARLVQRSEQMQSQLENRSQQMLEQLQGAAEERPVETGEPLEPAALAQQLTQQGEAQIEAITQLKSHVSDLMHGTMGHFADEVEQRVGQMLKGSLDTLDEVSELLRSKGDEAGQGVQMAEQLESLTAQSRSQNEAILAAIDGATMGAVSGDETGQGVQMAQQLESLTAQSRSQNEAILAAIDGATMGAVSGGGDMDAAALVPMLQKRMEESLQGTLGELEKLLEDNAAQSNARTDQLAQAMADMQSSSVQGVAGEGGQQALAMSQRLEALVADMDGRLTLLQQKLADEQGTMQRTLEAWAERIAQTKEEEKSLLADHISAINDQNETRHKGMMGALDEVSRTFSGDMEQMRRDMEESSDLAADKLVKQLRKVVHGASEEQSVYIEMLGERMDALRKKIKK
ncbi:hypothetical protein [Magnetococcus sp. PR-3]|uniref:hypothetical protein n=1 Tax=Magnetococcus sp. PR-3 TaxID=3120355 RepID=UPI002FCE403C